jgi:hypothetical protein
MAGLILDNEQDRLSKGSTSILDKFSGKPQTWQEAREKKAAYGDINGANFTNRYDTWIAQGEAAEQAEKDAKKNGGFGGGVMGSISNFANKVVTGNGALRGTYGNFARNTIASTLGPQGIIGNSVASYQALLKGDLKGAIGNQIQATTQMGSVAASMAAGAFAATGVGVPLAAVMQYTVGNLADTAKTWGEGYGANMAGENSYLDKDGDGKVSKSEMLKATNEQYSGKNQAQRAVSAFAGAVGAAGISTAEAPKSILGVTNQTGQYAIKAAAAVAPSVYNAAVNGGSKANTMQGILAGVGSLAGYGDQTNNANNMTAGAEQMMRGAGLNSVGGVVGGIGRGISNFGLNKETIGNLGSVVSGANSLYSTYKQGVDRGVNLAETGISIGMGKLAQGIADNKAEDRANAKADLDRRLSLMGTQINGSLNFDRKINVDLSNTRPSNEDDYIAPPEKAQLMQSPADVIAVAQGKPIGVTEFNPNKPQQSTYASQGKEAPVYTPEKSYLDKGLDMWNNGKQAIKDTLVAVNDKTANFVNDTLGDILGYDEETKALGREIYQNSGGKKKADAFSGGGVNLMEQAIIGKAAGGALGVAGKGATKAAVNLLPTGAAQTVIGGATNTLNIANPIAGTYFGSQNIIEGAVDLKNGDLEGAITKMGSGASALSSVKQWGNNSKEAKRYENSNLSENGKYNKINVKLETNNEGGRDILYKQSSQRTSDMDKIKAATGRATSNKTVNTPFKMDTTALVTAGIGTISNAPANRPSSQPVANAPANSPAQSNPNRPVVNLATPFAPSVAGINQPESVNTPPDTSFGIENIQFGGAKSNAPLNWDVQFGEGQQRRAIPSVGEAPDLPNRFSAQDEQAMRAWKSKNPGRYNWSYGYVPSLLTY